MVTIVDYGMGNLHSVAKAFEFLGEEATVSRKPEDIERADRLVLPGVGAFGDGMKNLRERGLDEAIVKYATGGKPLLGICLGMQLLANDSTEGGLHKGLGLIDANVRKLEVERLGLKVPHVGWNEAFPKSGARLFSKCSKNPSFYFVHSFAVQCNDPADAAAMCNYGNDFAAAVQRGNIYGVQFHPEKSQGDGMAVLKCFIEL